MLVSLHIENIAVAKRLDLDFNNGFNVLTGETGAGKSIIIDSIGMITGGKASRDLIRHGEDHAFVSALFSDIGETAVKELAALGFSYTEDEALTVSRTINQDGRGICKLNGRTVPLATVRAIAPFLINIHGQNESFAFMNKDSHRRTLDEYAGLSDKLAEYQEAYEAYQSTLHRLKELMKAEKERGMMSDVLKFQISEIESAKLSDPEEEDKLYALRNKLKNAEKMSKHASLVYRALYDNEKGASACYLIDRAISSLNQLGAYIEEAPKLASRLTDFRYEIENIAETVSDLTSIDGIEDPEEQLNQTEHRISQIRRLKGKYGADIAEILATYKQLKEKMRDFDECEDRIAEAKRKASEAYKKAALIAREISDLRKPAAEQLSAAVCESLAFLDMPKVRFVIRVERALDSHGKETLLDTGADTVEFFVSTNPGDPLMPMEKVASGGELSRMILALKSIMNDRQGAGTSVFDEVDSGVSGSTSQKIGIKLKQIASETQVLCVTHSAQIASLADAHYLIKKSVVGDRAETAVTLLDREGRITEISRIIGGIDITDAQRQAAEDMICQGSAF
ncbi:MAG: DNA repair protein RecN [Clostridia bacterium]|nr:DNA repair protein RecN [Clostridia bacterium]